MLAIVIVSYNTRALLHDCLSSVYRGLERSGLPGEVWVIDNASSDDSAADVRRHFPTAHLIANADNRGFAAANNQALRAMGFGQGTTDALPDAVLLLNPDTLVLDDALGQMYRTLTERPRAGAVGAALVYEDGSFQHSAFRFPTLFQILLDFFPINYRLADSRLNGRYPGSLYRGNPPFPIDHPLGAAMMVRGETVQRVGLMDETFFMYCEEIDLCLRIRRSGQYIWCVPQARIVHYAGQSTSQFRDKMFVALWRSRFVLFDKHYNPLFRWAARRLVAIAACRARREVRRAEQNRQKDGANADELQRRAAAYRRIQEL